MESLDLFVIGGGSGGVRAARLAAAKGKKVAIAESHDWGGTCVNLGCVPKKLFKYAADFSASFGECRGFGWSVEASSFDWATLRENKNQEIERLNKIYEHLLEKPGAEVIRGRAKILSPHVVSVGERRIEAKAILIAVGARPNIPEIPGAAEHCLVSDDLFHLPELPKRVAIIGGGYIAVEFAGILSGLGVEVTQLVRGRAPLTGFDEELRSFVRDEMQKTSVDLRVSTEVREIRRQDDGKTFSCLLNDGTELEVDRVVAATGRDPNTRGLGLDGVGIKTGDKGQILVDEGFETACKGIYAIGDVTGNMQLTPVALAEGNAFVESLFGENLEVKKRLDLGFVPTAVFGKPVVGTIGYREEDARQRWSQVKTYTSDFRPMKHTLSGSNQRSFVKLVTEGPHERVVGLHMVGEEAGEVIQGFSVAMNLGATKMDFDRTVGVHPSSAEELVTLS